METPSLRWRTTCRLCTSSDLHPVLQLHPTPPANALVENPNETQPTYPLNLHLCGYCGHLQMLGVVSPELLFKHYKYVSGTSRSFVQHFEFYADACIRSLNLKPDSLVVDIGSNDGTLLKFFRQRGMRVLGVDPAVDLARVATENGIPTMAGFFAPQSAVEIVTNFGKASLITANNVLAHVDDLSSIIRGVQALLAPDGTFVFEVQWAKDMVQQNLFDMVYHEHLSYHTVRALAFFFAHHTDLALFDVERTDTHGGSLRCFVKRREACPPISYNVAHFIMQEADAGLFDLATYTTWQERIHESTRALQELLHRELSAGRTLVGFGAPAKTTTLLHQTGIAPLLRFIVDDAPLKQCLYVPGTHLRIEHPRELDKLEPSKTSIVLLAWNFAGPIVERYHQFRESGGHIITPLPQARPI